MNHNGLDVELCKHIKGNVYPSNSCWWFGNWNHALEILKSDNRWSLYF